MSSGFSRLPPILAPPLIGIYVSRWVGHFQGAIPMFEAKKAGSLNWETSRCLYENEDILVMHNVMGFPDGSKEAVMVVHTLKDGEILKTETGARPIE